MRTQSSDPTHRRPASVRGDARIEFDSSAPIREVESLLATLPKSDRHRAATAPCLLAPRCIVILTIERKKIPPDIEVLEMNGRIILGNSSRDVELKLAEILSEHAKKIIFDLRRSHHTGQHRHRNFGGVPRKNQQGRRALAHRGRLWLRRRDIEDHKRGQTSPVVPFGGRSRGWLLDKPAGVRLILQRELRRFLYGSHTLRLTKLKIPC